MLRTARCWTMIGLLACTLGAPGLTAAKEPIIGGIVVFGTSLSDPGNAFALRGGTNTPPDYSVDPFLVPDRPYARGGHHFSNGASWIEQFARPLGLASSVQPAFRGAGAKASNYAVGGARARDVEDSFNLSDQVEAFLTRHGNVAPANALYVIEMGGNDIRDAMQAYLEAGGGDNGLLAAGAVIEQALASIGANAYALYQAGARKFLIWNVPNLGLTPAVRALDQLSPGAIDLANGLSQGYNIGLTVQVLGDLGALPQIELDLFNVYSTLQEIVANPSGFGLANAQAACITPQSAPYHCQNFDEYLFWDGIHPTTAAHAILAHDAATLLAH